MISNMLQTRKLNTPQDINRQNKINTLEDKSSDLLVKKLELQDTLKKMNIVDIDYQEIIDDFNNSNDYELLFSKISNHYRKLDDTIYVYEYDLDNLEYNSSCLKKKCLPQYFALFVFLNLIFYQIVNLIKRSDKKTIIKKVKLLNINTFDSFINNNPILLEKLKIKYQLHNQSSTISDQDFKNTKYFRVFKQYMIGNQHVCLSSRNNKCHKYLCKLKTIDDNGKVKVLNNIITEKKCKKFLKSIENKNFIKIKLIGNNQYNNYLDDTIVISSIFWILLLIIITYQMYNYL